MDDEEWKRKGVEFKVVTEDMAEDVKLFLWKHFFPDEPISRSLNLERNSFLDYMIVDETLKQRASIAAVDENGEILATRLGIVRNRNDWFEWITENIIVGIVGSKWLSKFLPEGYKKLQIVMKLLDLAKYDVWPMFDKFGCDKIYEDRSVCSARTHGIRGLGTEVVRRSEILAAELGCTHTYSSVTGIYSQKIFENLNHTTLTTIYYADYKDENGDLYLKDTREHTCVITNFKKLV